MSGSQIAMRMLIDRALPALLWAYFLYNNVLALVASAAGPADPVFQFRLVCVAMFNGLVMYLFLVRRPVYGLRSRPWGVMAAFLGTFASPLVALFPITQPGLTLAGNVLCVLGLMWSLASLAYLGRCLGILPEARGLITRGPYALVRHPMYFGHTVMTLGLLLPALSPASVVFWCAMVGLQLWRARNEERVLAAAFDDYAAYRQRTKILIPFVF